MEKLDVIASFNWMDKEEKVGTLGHEYLRGSDVFFFLSLIKTGSKPFLKLTLDKTSAPILGYNMAEITISSVVFLMLSLTDGGDD